MSDILVIVVKERDERTGRIIDVVSHGLNLDTDEIVSIQGGTPASVGAVFDSEIGEYIIRDSVNRPKPRN